MKSPAANKGRWLEEVILGTAAQYEREGVMRLRKVDPPLVLLRGQWILKASPFLDFVGSWTERMGRAIFIEAKSTKEPVLQVMGQGGLKLTQYASLLYWHNAASAAALVWAVGEKAVLVPVDMIRGFVQDGPKRLQFDEPRMRGFRIPQGKGFKILDFVEVMRRLYR